MHCFRHGFITSCTRARSRLATALRVEVLQDPYCVCQDELLNESENVGGFPVQLCNPGGATSWTSFVAFASV